MNKAEVVEILSDPDRCIDFASNELGKLGDASVANSPRNGELSILTEAIATMASRLGIDNPPMLNAIKCILGVVYKMGNDDAASDDSPSGDIPDVFRNA